MADEDDDTIYLDPSEIPLCKCGEICDRELVKGGWRHSKCDPEARERVKRTRELMGHVERLRKK